MSKSTGKFTMPLSLYRSSFKRGRRVVQAQRGDIIVAFYASCDSLNIDYDVWIVIDTCVAEQGHPAYDVVLSATTHSLMRMIRKAATFELASPEIDSEPSTYDNFVIQTLRNVL